MSPTAIIVDDEPNLIDYLQRRLAVLWPQLAILASAENGRAAITLANQLRPDIVFLDIQMPGLSGLQVAEALPADTKVVFVTAFDEFAVDAFERAAVDYLLKPVSDARLQQTIERLQHSSAQDPALMAALMKQLSAPAPSYLQWLRAGFNDTTQLVPVHEVVYFKSDHKYTEIVTESASYVLRLSIKELEQQLDPQQFWRIHRGLIVRVEQIVSAQRDLRGRYALVLRDRPEKLRSSAHYGHLFKQM